MVVRVFERHSHKGPRCGDKLVALLVDAALTGRQPKGQRGDDAPHLVDAFVGDALAAISGCAGDSMHHAGCSVRALRFTAPFLV